MKYLGITVGFIAAFLAAASSIVDAQQLDRTDRQAGSSLLPAANLMQPVVRSSVLDGPVDASQYIVGPGDQFTVSIWTSMPLNINVTVTPEGSVIVPAIGEYALAGKTLEEAKKIVVTEVRKKYNSSQVSFTLTTPRLFSVIVRGNVLKEGKQTVQATDRADVAIAMANTIATVSKNETIERQFREDQDAVLRNASQRRVEILHKDGTSAIVDFERYYALHDSRYNPYLRDGDEIVVPQKNLQKDYISVYGAVNSEGVKEYFDGDHFNLALSMARGVTPIVDSSRVEIIRYAPNGIKTGEYHYSLSDAVRDGGVALQRGDQIVIGERLELRRNTRVLVEGEVNSPGFYPITKDSTKLSEIITVANGFTPSVSLKNSHIYRRTVSENDIQNERLESARGGYTPEDSAYYFLETNIRINRELVPVDFERLFFLKDPSQDVYLRDGDVVSIGSKVKTIYIFGQVIKPGHYTFVPDKSVDQFIAEAGGFTSEARESDLRIIKSNTRQWLKPSETVIEEGDYIWVPKEPYRPGSYYLQQMSQIFGILGTVATLAVLVVQLAK